MDTQQPATARAGAFTDSDAALSPHFVLSTHFPSSPLLPRLEAHADALLAHRVRRETRKQLGQLQGELRDAYAARAWQVKADWMARVVPEEHQSDEASAAHSVQDSEADDETGSSEGPAPLQPTILSDADGAAEMARRVDGKVEEALAEQTKEAQARIEASVRRSEEMELVLWLGQEVLDAYSAAAEDDEQAARMTLDRLEDACFEAGVSVPASF
ncbi:uncharacterized protein JCM10292_002147 [Rhodotorula paludigena]|uniref:uncharacterized protein n=1 Tax=Rhodotorula paludigena TaxID=86838 RepID=UPI0031748C2B